MTSVELVEACLERIRETDAGIGAWAFLDPDAALEQASAMDALRQKGRPIGSLHGVPVGIQDSFDTANMPTAWGVKRYATRRPKSDAAIISKLQEAGAVILGKTATTELSLAGESRTRNPHNGERIAGGGSSGSAASIAAGHAPIAVGASMNGSVIRSASYCGVYGFTPSRGIISRRDCLQISSTLDQVGVMGRSLEDVALLGDVLAGFDPGDPASHTRPKPQMLKGSQSDAPVEPCFIWLELPFHDRLSDAVRQGLDELMEVLGSRVERQPAPQSFNDVAKHHQIIYEYEFYKNFQNNPEAGSDQFHDTVKQLLARARTIADEEYENALAMMAGAEKFFIEFFNDYDAILAPAALGEALVTGEGTGDPVCSTIWAFAGLPCLSLPLLKGETGLPVAVQLIGAAEEDDRLLRTATWLERHLSSGAENATDNGLSQGEDA